MKFSGFHSPSGGSSGVNGSGGQAFLKWRELGSVRIPVRASFCSSTALCSASWACSRFLNSRSSRLRDLRSGRAIRSDAWMIRLRSDSLTPASSPRSNATRSIMSIAAGNASSVGGGWPWVPAGSDTWGFRRRQAESPWYPESVTCQESTLCIPAAAAGEDQPWRRGCVPLRNSSTLLQPSRSKSAGPSELSRGSSR